MDDIVRAIPHRDPFLFVDKVIEISDDAIKAEKLLDPEMEFFKGHYPGFPIMPGVLTCECIFQAGAILLSQHAKPEQGKIPVLTRIKDARFKKMVKPGDMVQLEASIADSVSGAYYMKGSASVNGEVAVTVTFTCMLGDYEK